MDPIAVLNADKWDHLLRLAAYNVTLADDKARAEESKKQK